MIDSLFGFHPPGNLRRSFPLDNGAALQFRQFYLSSYLNYAFFTVRASHGEFRGKRDPYAFDCHGYVERLHAGMVVSQGNFGTGIGCIAQALTYAVPASEWSQKGAGFVGFRFNTGAGPRYGWARVRVTGEPQNHFILVDYAWGDPGDVVVTPTMPDESAAAGPNTESLGFLALGAPGLRALRSRIAPSGF